MEKLFFTLFGLLSLSLGTESIENYYLYYLDNIYNEYSRFIWTKEIIK